MPLRLFPFNWDPQRVGTWSLLQRLPEVRKLVSIQLGSPASGDKTLYYVESWYVMEFPFNWDPQRVGTRRQRQQQDTSQDTVSIQLGSPASGDQVPSFHT